MSADDVIDGELVEPGTDLAEYQHAAPPATLFRTDDPIEILARATETANALERVVRNQKLIVRIGQSDHARVEAWTMLGSLLGVYPVCVWTRPLDNGYEARVEARTRDGAVVGAAEAMCTRDERTWKTRDDYALRSMAQTRATSKALRQPLGFVMTLAGFDPTPAEEMPASGREPRGATAPPRGTQAPDTPPVADAQEQSSPPSPASQPEFTAPDGADRVISDAQRTRLHTIATHGSVPTLEVKAIIAAVAGVDSSKLIPRGKYDAVVAAVEAWKPEDAVPFL